MSFVESGQKQSEISLNQIQLLRLQWLCAGYGGFESIVVRFAWVLVIFVVTLAAAILLNVELRLE